MAHKRAPIAENITSGNSKENDSMKLKYFFKKQRKAASLILNWKCRRKQNQIFLITHIFLWTFVHHTQASWMLHRRTKCYLQPKWMAEMRNQLNKKKIKTTHIYFNKFYLNCGFCKFFMGFFFFYNLPRKYHLHRYNFRSFVALDISMFSFQMLIKID